MTRLMSITTEEVCTLEVTCNSVSNRVGSAVSDWNDFSYFFILPTKFRVDWPFGAGEEV